MRLPCTTFLVLSAFIVCPYGQLKDTWSVPSSVIADGTSIASASQTAAAVADSCEPSVHLTVENYCMWPLSNPVENIQEGKLENMPTMVLPGERESVVMCTKPAGFVSKVLSTFHLLSKTKSYGSISWKLAGGKLATVMWSITSSSRQDNTLAVGVTTGNATANDILQSKDGNFVKRHDKTTIQPIQYCDEIYCIRGSLEESTNFIVKVQVYTLDKAYLAQKAKEYLRDQTANDVAG